MSETDHRRWLITGCSTGFGRFLADAVLARGDKLLATARKPEVLADLVERYPETCRAVKLDVTDMADVEASVRAAEEAFGGVDVLINNAGFSVVGAIEELEPEEYRPLYETNVFGVLNMIRAFVPQMRERGSGVLAVVSSIGGQIASPGMAHYSATKSAVEMIHEGMQVELAPYGVRTLIIEPGLFRTAIIGSLWYPKTVMPEYDHASGAMRRFMEAAVGNEPGDPAKAARLIIEQVYDDAAPLRLPLGIGAAQRIKEKAASVTANMDALEARADDTSFDPA